MAVPERISTTGLSTAISILMGTLVIASFLLNTAIFVTILTWWSLDVWQNNLPRECFCSTGVYLFLD
uniref:7TM_GPCR_Srx domain-containing protein n=1 Tax=Meloidogyne hapla TaxID=6305 RepID=A0A1I8B3G9_MELHA